MKSKIILLTYAIIVSTAVFAAPEHTSGIYFGGSFGYGQTVLARPAIATTFERNGYTWSVLAGYQINPYISGEAGYFRMHNVFAAISSLSATSTVEPSFRYLAVKLRAPIYSAAIFTKLGGALTYGKEKQQVGTDKTTTATDTIVPYIAVGFEYPLLSRVYIDVSLSNTFNKGLVPRLTAGAIGGRVFLD